MYLTQSRLPAALWLGCALTLMACAGDSSNAQSADTPGADKAVPASAGAKAQPAAKAPAAAAASGEDVHRYIDSMRSELSSGKVRLITDVMQLNATESGKFWPIYQEYEQELFDLGDQRIEGMRAFVKAQQNGALDDKTAGNLADLYFAYEEGRLALLKKYYGLIAKELSPVRAAQFTQIEHRVGTATDLIIASQLPLIRHEAAAPTARSTPASSNQE
jgi:hypothetical protein